MAAARLHDPNTPVTVAAYATEMEADLLSSELKRAGIDARTLGGTISGFKAEVPSDVTVVVPFSRLAEAIALRDELARNTTVDWSQVDIGDSEDAASSDAAPQKSQPNGGIAGTLRTIVVGILMAAGLFVVGILLYQFLMN